MQKPHMQVTTSQDTARFEEIKADMIEQIRAADIHNGITLLIVEREGTRAISRASTSELMHVHSAVSRMLTESMADDIRRDAH